MDDTGRIFVYRPGEADGDAGLAVRLNENAGPHETKYTIEQLWPPVGNEENGRVEPVYVGDELRVLSLIDALTEALEADLGSRLAGDSDE